MPTLRFLIDDTLSDLNERTSNYLNAPGVVDLFDGFINLDVEINEETARVLTYQLRRLRMLIAVEIGATVAPLDEVYEKYKERTQQPLLETVSNPRDVVIVEDPDLVDVITEINAELQHAVTGLPEELGADLEHDSHHAVHIVISTVRVLQVIQILLNDIDDQIAWIQEQEAETA